ncbi:hypothetical protein AK812_SmicGene40081 [Symbiodinium microadriaticum]|uniref:Uncharacterized protein n=1 Tax=Symbiodinium microadriaticum TaxID=2951 RepID=A0A1Q9C9M2_SYMMI|nr:hypothetical protein AK812_SmicGene40081 [Symbiodinium microadriaticum]
MNIPEPLNRSFLEFEQMMKEQHVFRNPSRDPIGKGKKGGKAECQGKAECPGKGNVGKGKGKARDKNQIVRTYYAPAEDTRQIRRLFFKEDEGLGWWAQPGADEVNIPDGTGHWRLICEPSFQPIVMPWGLLFISARARNVYVYVLRGDTTSSHV